MVSGGFNAMTSRFACPVLSSIGNHDTRGPGGLQSWREIVQAAYDKNVKCIDRKDANFYFEHGGDIYFFYDFLNPDLDMLEKANLGTVIKKLKELDYSDGHPDLSKQDYALLEQIREIRNYWCHQCYLDYVYIQDDWKRERKFQQIAERLHNDENRTYELSKRMEQLRFKILRYYDRI
jgi:hypothetical protein